MWVWSIIVKKVQKCVVDVEMSLSECIFWHGSNSSQEYVMSIWYKTRYKGLEVHMLRMYVTTTLFKWSIIFAMPRKLIDLLTDFLQQS